MAAYHDVSIEALRGRKEGNCFHLTFILKEYTSAALSDPPELVYESFFLFSSICWSKH